MRALVLDFDGVISDSVHECFAVARRTFLDLAPDSPLAGRDPEELFPAFLEALPLGNGADDFGTVLAALHEQVSLPDQRAYDAFRATRDVEWLARFRCRFYERRRAWTAEDPAGWVETMRPYSPFLDLLQRRAGSVDYAIATAKDRASVERLLRHYGIAQLIPSPNILDKESGPDKSVHLKVLRQRLGHDFEALTFLDDKVNHLDSVAPLGVRCALAAWGYNGPREQRAARARGYLVCHLDDAERRLFG